MRMHSSAAGCFVLVLVTSTATAQTPSGRAPMSPIVQADHAVEQGTVTYNVRPFYPAAPPNSGPNQPYRTTVSFATGGKYLRTRRSLSSGDAPTLTQKSDGEHVMSMEPKSIRVERPDRSNPVPELMTLTPGPCAVLGRGFSRLKNPVLGGTTSHPSLKGLAADGTSVEADLDPVHGWIATRIVRRISGGHLAGLWVLAAPVRSADGVWVPSAVTFTGYTSDGKVAARDSYRLARADFRHPPPATFIAQIGDKTVIDARTGYPVGLSPKAVRPQNIEQALAATERGARRLAELRAGSEANERRSQAMGGVRLALYALLGVSLVAFAWVLRSRTRQA